MDKFAGDSERLKRRIRYFLGSRRKSRYEVREFIDAAQRFGRVAIIGGMLRDLAFASNREFTSDVDLVIDLLPRKKAAFEGFLRGLGAKRNKMGGWKVQMPVWRVEIWILAETWAKREGHRSVLNFQDLLQTTFFDWDAVVYDIEARRIHCAESYLARLAAGVIDVNLEPNANITNVLVRTFRFVVQRGAQLSPRLRDYVLREMEHRKPADLCAAERGGHRRPALSEPVIEAIRRQLVRHQKSGESAPFRMPKEQLQLAF